MTDNQYVKMDDGKMLLVKQKSRAVITALHTMWRPVVMDKKQEEPDEAVELLVSLRPDIGTEPKQERCERAVA